MNPWETVRSAMPSFTMRRLRRGFSVLILATHCGLGLAGDHGGFAPLKTSTFDDFLQTQHGAGRAALVMFHVSWCKACQRTFPFFSAAADAVAGTDVPVSFAHVECTDDK
ncbi:unnamed protein product, partial [Effrenium voratum]